MIRGAGVVNEDFCIASSSLDEGTGLVLLDPIIGEQSTPFRFSAPERRSPDVDACLSIEPTTQDLMFTLGEERWDWSTASADCPSGDPLLPGTADPVIKAGTKRGHDDTKRHTETVRSCRRARVGGPKPRDTFRCNVCRLCFGSTESLDAHLDSVHTDAASFQCTVCGDVFRAKRLLAQHTRAVHRRQRFQCVECKALFKALRSRDAHVERVHMKKRFPCSTCGRDYSSKSALTKHVRVVHMKEKPFSCPKCALYFASRFQVKSHLARRHKIE
jgi:uncharacterized C2H2 Zn-finger protein